MRKKITIDYYASEAEVKCNKCGTKLVVESPYAISEKGFEWGMHNCSVGRTGILKRIYEH